jgi:PadR family transcriptional regulator, regulatory protein AphA
MSSDPLSLFSYEVLGLIGDQGAGPHDLRQMVRRGRMLDWAGESQYYAEPKRLAKLGYLEARTEPGKTRPRTVYNLTEKGRAALREYARTPAKFVPVKSDALVRLLIADLVGEKPTREALVAMREELDQLSRQVAEAEESARTLPHRSHYLLMVTAFLRGLLALHRELIERVERELRED